MPTTVIALCQQAEKLLAIDRTPDASPEVQPEVSPLDAYKEKARERLMAKVSVNEAPHPRLGTPCWMHSGGTRPKGGHRWFQYSHEGVTDTLAHRASYRIHNGEIPQGMLVRHRCDNPACVNPDHLELGTHQQNSSDRALRGTTTVRAKSGIPGVYRQGNGWSSQFSFMGKSLQKYHKFKEDAAAWVTEQRQRLHGALVSYPASRPLVAPAAQLALF